MGILKIKNKIVEEIRKTMEVAVIGLSGGADSLLVTLLAKEALGAENVFTVGMPYGETDLKHFNSLSRKYAEHLGIPYQEVTIKPIADAIDLATHNVVFPRPTSIESKLTDLNKGNSRSRARMTVLYGVAHHLGSDLSLGRVRVAGTGNLSEDFIGYDTKGGDSLADIFPIGDLFKSEVYALLEWYRDQGIITEEMINRNPSAGLWNGQTDADEIGFTYDEMQPGIENLLKSDWFINRDLAPKYLEPMTQFVYVKHMQNRHKHEAPPVVELRDEKGKLKI